MTVALAAALAGIAMTASPAFANDPPVCSDDSHTVASGTPLHLQGNCTDTDGPSPLTYSLVSGPTSGTLSGSPSGSATYQSYLGFSGTDSFTYRANTATITITVTGPPAGNQAPICPDSNAFVASGSSIDLAANCEDPEGDSIIYGLGPGPTGGSLAVLSASSVRYTPNPGTTQDSFVYTARDNFHPAAPVTVNVAVTASSNGPFETASDATDSDPYVASVNATQPGAVGIDTRAATSAQPTGFVFFNQEFDITAPPALDASAPLRLVFTIDASVAPTDPITVFRNGSAVADCTGAPSAVPDPCVEDVTTEGDGDVRVSVLTTHASVWNFGVSTAYDFSGFFRPVDNRPDLNGAKAGSSIPVKFSLDGDQGLDVFAPGYPKSQQIACDSTADVNGVETTVGPGPNVLSYDGAADQYQYVWKTKPEWAGTCRQLVVKFGDPSQSTYRADFKFK